VCPTAVLFGKELAKYGFGNSHPWSNDRIYAFWSKLQDEGLSNIVVEEPELANEQDVLSFHDRKYFELVKIASKHGSNLPLDRGDTPAFKGVLEATLYVVGSTLAALDMVVAGKLITHSIQ
jgi:acetoin utilization protein AcuC